MTREQVVTKLEQPDTVMSGGGTEVPGYTFEGPYAGRSQFRVKRVNSKVQSCKVLNR